MSKKSKSNTKSSAKTESKHSSYVLDYESTGYENVSLTVYLTGEYVGDYKIILIFNGNVLQEAKCVDGLELIVDELPVDFKNPIYREMFLNSPLIVLIRKIGKGSKETDPLLHPDNIAGTNFDLSPLLFELTEVLVKEHLCLVTGEKTDWRVTLRAFHNTITPKAEPESTEVGNAMDDETLVTITMLSAHCLPSVKDNIVFMAAIGLDGLTNKVSVSLGSSVSNESAQKLVWADACTGGIISTTAFSVPEDDVFVPENLNRQTSSECASVYWNTIKRIPVDSNRLKERLSKPFMMDIAGIQKKGKAEVKGRYLAFVDTQALLEPDQLGLTTSAKLLPFSETLIPEDQSPLLELPISSKKSSAREVITPDFICDEAGHEAYIVIRIDLLDPVTPEENIKDLSQLLDLTAPRYDEPTVDQLYVDPPPPNPFYDTHRIRREGGALAVHKELSALASSGAVQMSQSIKRTAANRLLLQVRTMLKQFPPDTQSTLEWQETITAQHAASRRAVTASFAPQPPLWRITPPSTAVKARMAGDKYIYEKHLENNLKVSPNHPKIILPMILNLLEKRSDRKARILISKALRVQSSNTFLLWLYGAQEFPVADSSEKCIAAFRISVNGDYSDGVANTIGWAALHTAHHHFKNKYAAFVAKKYMRKYCSLNRPFREFVQRWTEASGQEEIFWRPNQLTCEDPLLFAAAFFLCLRCYDLSDRLLKCYTQGCALKDNHPLVGCADEYYLRAASWFLRRQVNEALEAVKTGVTLYGPNSLLTQMALICESYNKNWVQSSENLFLESEKAGADALPNTLLQSAAWLMKKNPQEALQRAARAHKEAPGAHSALLIGRIYDKLKEAELAGQWVEGAVKLEPLLADGWAFLAYLAMRQLDVPGARALMRTARQVGPISSDIQEIIDRMNRIVPIDDLSEIMVKNFCMCKYY